MTTQLLPLHLHTSQQHSSAAIEAPFLSDLIQQRFDALCCDEEYDPDIHGLIFLVEPGDCITDVERISGCPITYDPFTSARFGDPGFAPLFELLEEHDFCFEMVFVPGDGDFGIVIFIPKTEDIDPDLLAFCEAYAVPAEEAS